MKHMYNKYRYYTVRNLANSQRPVCPPASSLSPLYASQLTPSEFNTLRAASRAYDQQEGEDTISNASDDEVRSLVCVNSSEHVLLLFIYCWSCA